MTWLLDVALGKLTRLNCEVQRIIHDAKTRKELRIGLNDFVQAFALHRRKVNDLLSHLLAAEVRVQL